MSKQLPPKPSLEQLKKQARDLCRAHGTGDADAIGRLREHLPRLSEAPDDEIRQAEDVEARAKQAARDVAGDTGS